jgi:hypothetical protein
LFLRSVWLFVDLFVENLVLFTIDSSVHQHHLTRQGLCTLTGIFGARALPHLVKCCGFKAVSLLAVWSVPVLFGAVYVFLIFAVSCSRLCCWFVLFITWCGRNWNEVD